MYSENMGSLIRSSRENRRISQSKLCRGICSVSELSKIESGKRIPGYFFLLFLTERLGISTKNCEMVISDEEYERMSRRFRTDDAISNGTLDGIEEVEQYSKNPEGEMAIEKQHLLHIKGILALYKSGIERLYSECKILQIPPAEGCNEEAKKAYSLLESAFAVTHAEEVRKEGRLCLSSEEMNIFYEKSILEFVLCEDEKERDRIVSDIVLTTKHHKLAIAQTPRTQKRVAKAGIICIKWLWNKKEYVNAFHLYEGLVEVLEECTDIKVRAYLSWICAEMMRKHDDAATDSANIAELYKCAYYLSAYAEDKALGQVKATLEEMGITISI